MKKITVILFSMLVLLTMISSAAAEETSGAINGVQTNVYFCRAIPVGDDYELDCLPTLYLGRNELGRLIFAAGTDNLEKGDYVLVQETPDGVEFIQFLTIEPFGSGEAPEYVILDIEIREADLIVPLEIYGSEASGTTATVATAEDTTATTAPAATQPESTKTPLSTVSVIMAGLIAMMCVFVLRK